MRLPVPALFALVALVAGLSHAAMAQSIGDLLGGVVRGATGLPVPSVGGPSAESPSRGRAGGTGGQAVYVCAKRVGEGNAAFAQKEGVLPGLGGGWGGVAARKDEEAKHCFNAALTAGLSNCRDIGYGCSECQSKAGNRTVFVVRGAGGALGRCP
jgi:hypothetical protein